MSDSNLLSRRDFITSASAAAMLMVRHRSFRADARAEDPAHLSARPAPPTKRAQTGVHPLGLGYGRDGFIYVPPSYSPERPAPLLVLLHGAGHSSSEWSSKPLDTLLGARGIVAIAPDSRGTTWDFLHAGFGEDVAFIDRALTHVFQRCVIDPKRIGLAGFSDGASYALSLGASNGDLFNELIAFSPGFFSPSERRGKPRIFISHGTSDQILSIDRASRVIVPRLEGLGYDVKYTEFDGIHTVPLPIANAAFDWFLA